MPSVFLSLFRWCLRGYIAYLLLCLFILMPAMNIMAPRLVKDTLNRELRSELILFNPFTLTLEARGVTIREAGGHVPVGFDSLQINLSLESLWDTGVVLDAFVIRQLDIHVLRDAAGDFHFADLAGESDEEEPESPAQIPGITIHELLIEAHTIRYTDETRPGPYTTAQSDFRVRTQNLTTVPDRESNGDLVVTGDGGGLLRWNGDLEIAAGRSRGRVSLENIDLTPAWRYEAENLPFVLHSARFNAVMNYSVDWNDTLQATLTDSELSLSTMDVSPADSNAIPNTAVQLEELAVTGIAADLAEQSAGISAISINGLHISGYDEDGAPSLLAMFDMAQETGEEGQNIPDTPTDNASGDADTPWGIALERLTLENSDIAWRTGYLSPEVLELAPISLEVRDIAWPAKAGSPFRLALTVNALSTLDLSGQVNIGSGDGNASVALTRWPLPWLNPIVEEQARAHIGRGEFSLESTVALADFAPSSVLAALKVEDFGTVLEETGQEAFTFKTMTVDGIAADVPGQSLVIENFALQAPSGSLHIQEDGVINVNGIVRGGPVDEEASDAGEENRAGESASPEQTEESAPWRVQLANFRLREGRLDFADASLPLHFKTLIDGIEADIADIDTASEKPLKMEFKGSVDGYAPVVILGSGKPLADQRDGELRFTFRGMDIATMSPYSGTYAGYTLDSGTLSLDLRYALDGQTLEGDNRIVISQMELGEPVESELAIDAPLKLGIALLTDSEGVIDLSVPISGNVDSPDFSLGPIIGRAIKNIIVKAVTAPFSLLAGLVGSDDDLENIAFAPGSSALDGEAQRALEALGTALLERPQLQLRIAGGANRQSDAAALKEARLREVLASEGIDAAMIDAQNEAFLKALTLRYEALSIPAETEGAEDSEAAEVAPDTMWKALIEDTALAAAALQDLATARAAAAKRELVTLGGVDPARIAISYDAELDRNGVQMIVDS
ncbi:DUF748 domain-containing protein [Congregibacter litoralis]|uniref:DUF748 domain-containing protein n=1 Tax=Congregibacter litoralis KT71 TaxID=314285 RepID=A4A3Z9_9GAMM|nr:DUF748 domain-containing protein [Congregibacter litoralis]EAQ99422.1 Domain protein of Unknown Function [Congregibacter litoralis KT71]